MIDPIDPCHMDVGSRNRRLYELLKGMGLVVSPISHPDPRRKDQIDCILVSVSAPVNIVRVAGVQPTVSASDVFSPLQGNEVEEVVGPSLGDGDKVVLFPPKL